MKARLKIDGLLAILMGIVSIYFLIFPAIYGTPDRTVENILFVFGLSMIIKGSIWRALARGHKRKFPRWDLVTTGPYSISRNPMYLGTFLIGTGFLLIAWPWWLVPAFAIFFYWRFVQEVKKEEAQLADCHKENYREYCKLTPRVWPKPSKAYAIRMREIMDVGDLTSTHEFKNILITPVAGFVLELLQEYRVFGRVFLGETALLFAGTVIFLTISSIIFYKVRS